VAVEAIRAAANRMSIELSQATLAVVGAAGAIGAVCAEMLAADVGKLLLIGRQSDKLTAVAQKVKAAGAKEVEESVSIERLIDAELVITVTSAIGAIIEPQHLKPGAVICDVARPRDVSRQVVEQRRDVLVIEGGMVAVPGPVDFGFNFGFPPGMAYACMAETMALALEENLTSYTLGKKIELSQVLTIDKIARRHGFQLGGFRSFERAITEAEISAIKQQADISQAPSGVSLLL
jgi:predicted amino acid dehydrogenase